MGDAFDEVCGSDGARPVHRVRLDAFTIDSHPVTNDNFALFVRATGYVTEAEQLGTSAVFAAYVRAAAGEVIGRSGTALVGGGPGRALADAPRQQKFPRRPWPASRGPRVQSGRSRILRLGRLHNTGDDGWLATSPVTSFPANGYACTTWQATSADVVTGVT